MHIITPVRTKIASSEAPLYKDAAPDSVRMYAIKLLIDPLACATPTYYAAEALIGESITDWEPESVWEELKDKGIDVPSVNRDKIQAMITYRENPALFYTDAIIFEKTVLALNDTTIELDYMQEASPGQMAWAVTECARFGESIGYASEFDNEVVAYTACALHNDGLFVAPDDLEYCQEYLHTMTSSTDKEVAEVKKLYRMLQEQNSGMNNMQFKEDRVSIQVGALVGAELVKRERNAQYWKQIQALRP